MENVWIKVLNQSISVSVVILAVLLVRGIVMRKVPKKCVFLLWAVVGLRLLIPVGVTTSIEWLQKVPDKIEQSTEKSVENKSPTQKEVKVESAEITEGKITNAESQNSQSVSANSSQTVKSKESQKKTVEKFLSQAKQRLASEKVIQVTAYLWIGGMVLFGMWNLLTCVQMKKRLRQAVLYKDNIYECDKVGSPFVMGVVRPRIYIPFRLGEEELSYILKHEQYHIKRKDYLTKFVACMLMGIYWFHPLVWVAYYFMVQDMEMSCDEYVVQTMGNEIKINISKEVIEPYTKYEQNVVEVISGATGKVVYTMGNMSDINLVHLGYNSLYLYHGKDKEYLLNWKPVMYQGNASYEYEIFTVNESGKKDVLEKEEFSFYTGDMNKSKIQKYKDFIEKVNNKLKNSDILLSTLDGILVTYNDLPDYRLLFDPSEDLETMNAMNGGY